MYGENILIKRYISGWLKVRVLIDSFIILFSLYLSLFLRLGSSDFLTHVIDFHKFAFIFLFIRIICFSSMEIYASLWRYVCFFDAHRLARAMLLSVALNIVFSHLSSSWGNIPRSVFFIDLAFCFVLLLGARILRRFSFEWQSIQEIKKVSTRSAKKILIYGAGSSGLVLLRRLRSSFQESYEIVGFIDDDPVKLEKSVGGVKVLGNGQDLKRILENRQVDKVIIAISGVKNELLKSILQQTIPYGIELNLVTDFTDVPQKNRHLDLYRKIDLGDLLNRKVSSLKIDMVLDIIMGEVVLVTGAGGSIGREIARQIKTFKPSKLILLDHSEFNLYSIDQELRTFRRENPVQIISVLADIRERNTLRVLFETHRPFIVFHAAAYKHVHLVEENPLSSILNNIEGTKNLLEMAAEFNLRYFINISTDKAVNPAGVMGATKKVCELLTSSFGHKKNALFSSVRFGNVLGSSGSLLPLLKEQIQKGGPITLTHKDMERYFMLIPEAVRLVILSSVISKPGDVNILKMGEPIKIIDMAENLLALMGFKKDEIPIIFTGVRPGEKISEELYLKGDEVQTIHPDILTISSKDIFRELGITSSDYFLDSVSEIIKAAQEGREEAVDTLSHLVRQSPLPILKIFNEGIEKKDSI